MTKLKIVNGEVCCPKCGSSDVQHEYADRYVGRFVVNPESGAIKATDHELEGNEDYIARCRNCQWEETDCDVDVW